MTPRDIRFVRFEGKTTPESFTSSVARKWFGAGFKVDQEIHESFADQVERFAKGEYRDWKETPRNNLAAILLSDQFTRCIYRNSAKQFDIDSTALEFAHYLLDTGMIGELDPAEKVFVFMPFEHTEDLELQKLACRLFKELHEELAQSYGEDNELVKSLWSFCGYAERHRRVIERFGRFPHRNGVLRRDDTPEEIQATKDGTLDSFFQSTSTSATPKDT